MRKDLLNEKIDKSRKSYWIARGKRIPKNRYGTAVLMFWLAVFLFSLGATVYPHENISDYSVFSFHFDNDFVFETERYFTTVLIFLTNEQAWQSATN